MRVALYARVSTESQQARGTIGSQLAMLRDRIGVEGDVEGDEVVAEFCDDGHSGARLDRPGLAVLRDAATTDRHRYVGRTGSLARFEIARPTTGDRLRVVRELPWFARNLVVKVLLRLRLRLLVRLLGHRDTADPY